MTVLDAVQSSAREGVVAVANATSGLGGILTAPLATNRTTAGAVKSEFNKLFSAVFDLAAVPPLVVIYMLYTGGDDEPFAFRLGKGTFYAFVAWFLIAAATEVAR
jgi:hypothetical protein